MRKLLFRVLIFLTIIVIYVVLCRYLKNDTTFYNNSKTNDNNSKYITNTVINEKEDSYFAHLVIPKIGLDRYLFPVNSSDNNVDKNIEILKSSSMPDVDGGNFILAAHNGNNSVAFFKRLHELQEKDEVIISYNGLDYRYVVSLIYDVPKTGKVSIKRDKSKTTITMITCLGKDRQLVVIGYLM